ncbi:MAG: glycosyltransferase [Proteobacteria bacterium]|nr:glycosyltransferase [Pseudomonadota bacterium]
MKTSSNEPQPLLSVVIPMYNEGDNLDVLFARLGGVLAGVSDAWEIVCVNDGSADDTLQRLQQWREREPRIKYLSLSRNFGKESALTAGINHARGQAVIPFDADLQDPPELIPEMVRLWREEGYKVVLATRKSRHGENWLKRATAWMFYRLLARMTSIPVPPNTGDFRLMDQQVVEVLRLLPERTRFMKGLFAWVGFRSTCLYFDRAPRSGGQPKQSWGRLWGLAKDGIFSFTTIPLKMTTYLGVCISTLAFGYAFWLLLRTVILGVDVPGYASLMASILCMGGLQLICLGIIGEYIGRIYREAKQRPLYVVEQQAGLSKTESQNG